MGITFVKAKIFNPQNPNKSFIGKFLVDSGAAYTVVPGVELKNIGIRPHRKQEFHLADGTVVVREVGDGIFEYEGIRGAAPVVFGKKGGQRASWSIYSGSPRAGFRSISKET